MSVRPRLPRSPLTWSLTAGATVAVAGAFLALQSGGSDAATAATRTTTVKRGVVQSTVTGSGNLAPAKEVDLDFGTSGKVTKVYVKEGEHVSAGQLIARIANASQRADLAQAQADLESAETALEAAGGSASNVDAAASNEQTAVLVNAVATNAVAVATTPEQATTPQATTPSGGASTSSGADASGSGSTSSSSGSSSSGGSTGASPSTAGSASASGGTSSGGAAASAGSTSEASAEATYLKAKLAVEEAEEALDDTELRAPVAGTITALSGSVGDQVSGSGSATSSSSSAAPSRGTGATVGGVTTGGTSSSSAFAVLSQLSKLSMSVSFSESDIGKVKVGQAATVSVSALDGVKLAARVTKVGLTGSTSNSVVSYPVELTLSQNASGVRAGMSAEAEIVVEQATGVLTVPTQALSGRTLTVVDDDGGTTSATVTVGITGDSTTQIVSGVSVGDTIKLPTLATSSASSSASGQSGTESRQSGQSGALSGFGGASGGPPSGGGMPSGGGFPGP
jgi:HlyD family secretion protein